MKRPSVCRPAMITTLLAAGLTVMPSEVEASLCDMLAYHVDEAETNLRRASRADNVDDGTRYARRASYALSDAALAAMDCDCSLAYIEFDTAASEVRRAKNAAEAEEFFHQLRGAIRAYNTALDALQACD